MRKAAVALTTCIVLICSSSVPQAGRPDKSWKNWFGHLSGGWVFAQGDLSDIIDDDFTLHGGATYWPSDWPFGIELDLSYTEFDVSNSAIDRINDQIMPMMGDITGGDVTDWSITANVVWSPGDSGFYLTGGVGGYYLDGQLHTVGLVYYPPICDPWWWWCYPGGVGPGTIVVGSKDTFESGLNIGLGWDFELSSGSQVFLEVKYHRVDTDRESSDYVPFLVGYRW